VTGVVEFTGGVEMVISGGVMSGESATVEVDIGGNAGIINCSAVQGLLENRVTPLRVTRLK